MNLLKMLPLAIQCDIRICIQYSLTANEIVGSTSCFCNSANYYCLSAAAYAAACAAARFLLLCVWGGPTDDTTPTSLNSLCLRTVA